MFYDEAWEQVATELRILSSLPDFPLWTTTDGWVTIPADEPSRGILPHHGSWMTGDLPAMLWFAASQNAPGAPAVSWTERAMDWSTRLKSRVDLDTFASVSHMFFRGALLPIELAGQRRLEPMLDEAAETISRRFRQIGYMKSFGSPDDETYLFTTIDDVINLAIPLWYARKSQNAALASAAVAAAVLIADRLVRRDGSCAQILYFDEAGRPGATGTYQGYSDDGCWSRGQAWGIYGFSTLYRLTGDIRFRELAVQMSKYWVDRVQDNAAPIWDFDLPAGEPQIRDSFAGALAYAGILELTGAGETAQERELFTYATTMTQTIAKDYMFSRERGKGLLGGAALDVPHRHGIDCSVIVGDSYFVEALWRSSNPGHAVIE